MAMLSGRFIDDCENRPVITRLALDDWFDETRDLFRSNSFNWIMEPIYLFLRIKAKSD